MKIKLGLNKLGQKSSLLVAFRDCCPNYYTHDIVKCCSHVSSSAKEVIMRLELTWISPAESYKGLHHLESCSVRPCRGNRTLGITVTTNNVRHQDSFQSCMVTMV